MAYPFYPFRPCVRGDDFVYKQQLGKDALSSFKFTQVLILPRFGSKAIKSLAHTLVKRETDGAKKGGPGAAAGAHPDVHAARARGAAA